MGREEWGERQNYKLTSECLVSRATEEEQTFPGHMDTSFALTLVSGGGRNCNCVLKSDFECLQYNEGYSLWPMEGRYSRRLNGLTWNS